MLEYCKNKIGLIHQIYIGAHVFSFNLSSLRQFYFQSLILIQVVSAFPHSVSSALCFSFSSWFPPSFNPLVLVFPRSSSFSLSSIRQFYPISLSSLCQCQPSLTPLLLFFLLFLTSIVLVFLCFVCVSFSSPSQFQPFFTPLVLAVPHSILVFLHSGSFSFSSLHQFQLSSLRFSLTSIRQLLVFRHSGKFSLCCGLSCIHYLTSSLKLPALFLLNSMHL